MAFVAATSNKSIRTFSRVLSQFTDSLVQDSNKLRMTKQDEMRVFKTL